jgi:hypothetical protein
MEGVELAELERLEAVDDHGLGGGGRRPVRREEQQGMAAEPLGMGHDGGGGAVVGPGQLAVAGAAEQSVPGAREQRRALEPVGR